MSRYTPTNPLPGLERLTLEKRPEGEEGSTTHTSPHEHSPLPIPKIEPTPAPFAQAHHADSLQSRPRNRSPYSRSQLRSYTAANSLAAPPMTRTRSLPIVTSRSFNPSPSQSPVRQHSPNRPPPAPSSGASISPRSSFEETYTRPAITLSFLEIESIAEDVELKIPPRGPPSEFDFQSGLPTDYTQQPGQYATAPRSNSLNRRRPASPLHQIYQPPSFTTSSYTSSPATTPPPLTPSGTRYNESYPNSFVSSMPSTPTSVRSRSPSISSLGTIPDSPGEEEAAIENYNIAKLKAAADAADVEADAEAEGGRRRGSGGTLDPRARGASADKRKRWSVCGAERRGDFEMETIWED